MLVKMEGVVLRTQDYGESHKIVTLFTREQGKRAIMARGAKKPKSRLGAATQPFTLGFFLCYTGSGMATLSQAELLESYPSIRSDLLKTAFAAYWGELIVRLTEEREPHPLLYTSLLGALMRLVQGTHPDILTRLLEMKALETAGYRPRLTGCVQCGSQHGPFAFGVSFGGFLCTQCAHRDPAPLFVSEATVRILTMLQRITPARLGEVTLREETALELERVMHQFMDHYVDLPFRSRSFLQKLKKDWKET